MEYNQIPKTGTIGGMVDNVNANFQLTKEMLERLEVTKDHAVGLFSALATLNAAYPTPEVGDWALVGDTTPFAIYKCTTAGTWSDTGGTYDGGTIDLSDYVAKSEFDELDAVVNGGSNETPATTTWKEGGTMINYATGAESSNSTYYAASNFIQIPSDTSSIRLWALVIKPGSSFVTTCGIAFYDSSQTYISGIQREEYDHGGSSTAGMAERTYPVPNGARYMRTTCMVSQEGKWYCYFQSSTGSGLVGRMNEAELNIDAAAELAQEAYDLAEDASHIQPSHDVYRHASDPDKAELLTLSSYGRGVYTPVFDEEKVFNAVTIKAVKATADTTAEWRVYTAPNSSTAYDGVPASGNVPRSSWTLLASGNVDLTSTAADITLDTSRVACPAGRQVVICLLSPDEKIAFGRPESLQADTHVSFTSSATTWGSRWTQATSAYPCCAPVLRWESIIMSREEINDAIDKKIEEAAVAVDDYEILLADSIYCLVGSEVNIYDDTVSLSVDNAGHRSLNYTIEWRLVTNIAKAPVKRTPQGIRIRPTAAGTFQLRCSLLDLHDNVLDTKVITVYSVAKDALSSTKNILFLGASYTQPTNQIMYNILSGSDTYNTANGVATQRFSGICPTFWGTQGSGNAKCEGRGGWTWGSFHDGGDPVYNPDTDTYEYDTDSPIIDPSTGKVSASYYRASMGMGDTKFDLIIFQLGGNENVRAMGAQPKTVEQYKAEMRKWLSPMDDIVRNFHEDSPNAKIVLVLPRNYDNRWTGYAETLNTSFTHWEKNKASYAMCQLYYEWLDGYVASGGTNVVLSGSNFCFDRYYGMQLRKVPVNDRWAKEECGGREVFVSNVAHPSGVGYGQIADELAAEVAGRLTTVPESAPSGYQADGFYGIADEDVVNGKGLPFDVYATSAEPTDSGSTNVPQVKVCYYSRTNRFLGRYAATGQYFSVFPGDSLYMEDGHPKADVVYWLGDVPYMYNGTTLVKLSEMGGGSSSAVDQTARDAAAAAQTRADSAYTTANAALPASTIWSGTQAQYDALTAAQKSAVIAFIEEE